MGQVPRDSRVYFNADSGEAPTGQKSPLSEEAGGWGCHLTWRLDCHHARHALKLRRCDQTRGKPPSGLRALTWRGQLNVVQVISCVCWPYAYHRRWKAYHDRRFIFKQAGSRLSDRPAGSSDEHTGEVRHESVVDQASNSSAGEQVNSGKPRQQVQARRQRD